MIKFSGQGKNGRQMIGLGLSRGNWEQLMDGKPIHIHMEEVGVPYPVDIILMAGETEEAIVESLRDAGLHLPDPIDGTDQ